MKEDIETGRFNIEKNDFTREASLQDALDCGRDGDLLRHAAVDTTRNEEASANLPSKAKPSSIRSVQVQYDERGGVYRRSYEGSIAEVVNDTHPGYSSQVFPSRESDVESNSDMREWNQDDDTELGSFLMDHYYEDIFEIGGSKDGDLGPFHQLVSFFTSSKARETEGHKNGGQKRLTLSLAALNRMRMRQLQIKLAHRIMQMHYYDIEPADWEMLLEKYINATRDNDYIRSCVDRGLDDPFLITSDRKVDQNVLAKFLAAKPKSKLMDEGFTIGTQPDEGIDQIPLNIRPPLEKESRAIGGTRKASTHKEKTRAFFERIVFALVGGVLLVGPMWIMILVNTRYTSLIATSVFVIVAGLLASWKLHEPNSVLSVTAAYAAVLVVFVGTNTTPST